MICDSCGYPVEYRDMYCQKCYPDGLTLFKGVSKEIHDKIQKELAALRQQAGDAEKMATELLLERDSLAREADRLRADNTVLQSNNKTLRGEIANYKADFGKTDAQTIADLRAELALCETTHANLNDEYHALKKKMEEKDRDINHLWQRDSVWRAKKEMLENDLAKAWEQLARYREFIKKLADVKHEPDKLLCLLEREALKAVEGCEGGRG